MHFEVPRLDKLPAPVAVPRHRGPPAAPSVQDWSPQTLFQIVLIAPLRQRPDDRPQTLTFFGEHVLVATARRRLGCHDLFVDEQLESLGEDAWWDPQMVAQVAESPDAVEGVSNDQQRPSFTNHF